MPFQHLLKLDDDNLIDLARLLCGLSVAIGSKQVEDACMNAGLDLDEPETKLFDLHTSASPAPKPVR